MDELGYTERCARTSMKRMNKNKNHVILYQHCSAAGENSCPVRNLRRLFARVSCSFMKVHLSNAMVYI